MLSAFNKAKKLLLGKEAHSLQKGRYTFKEFKKLTEKKREEKLKELGYEMVDTEIARELCVGQIERDIEQFLDD